MATNDAHDEELQALAAHLVAATALLNSQDLQRQIGSGTTRELRYAISSFRQRFPDLLPGAQPSLF